MLLTVQSRLPTFSEKKCWTIFRLKIQDRTPGSPGISFEEDQLLFMLLKLRLLFVFVLTTVLLSAQSASAEQPNLIPNPGFEKFGAVPIGWFYKGEHFTRVMKYWSAATAASPDVFGPKVRVPTSWADKGFGKQAPHTGGAMVGMTLYGCGEGKPHCREYIQIQLLEPLVVGQDYRVEGFVARLPKSLAVNNLGFHFSENQLNVATDKVLELEPQMALSEIVRVPTGRWQQISGRFTATTPAEYLVVGNFATDTDTRIERSDPASLNYAYYYLDDLVLKKVPPILPIPVPADDLSRVTLEAGKSFELKNIFFEHDRTELLPRSYFELDKLVALFDRYPGMSIEIEGHTDTTGDSAYNEQLSRQRAETVRRYLIARGIEAVQVSARGFGSSRPVAENNSKEGRQRNRRVAFRVLDLGGE